MEAEIPFSEGTLFSPILKLKKIIWSQIIDVPPINVIFGYFNDLINFPYIFKVYVRGGDNGAILEF